MRFSPFSGADQCLFFTIPRTINDRALGSPTRLHQLTDGLGFSENCDHSANRIFSAVDPSVMMITTNNPFIGELASPEPGDHIVGGNCIEIEFERKMHRGSSGAQVIRDGQSPSP